MYPINRILLLCILSFSISIPAKTVPEQTVTFATADGGSIEANLSINGKQGVILAHGAIFNKDSWNDLVTTLAENNFTVLAINFRGYGASTSGSDQYALHQDILAAIDFLKDQNKINQVSVLGASMGGGAAAQAAIGATSGDIDKLILLSPAPVKHPEEIHANSILYIVSKDEAMATRIKAQYEKAPEPKQLFTIDGSAHAQHIFKSDQSDKLTQGIVSFLQNGHL